MHFRVLPATLVELLRTSKRPLPLILPLGLLALIALCAGASAYPSRADRGEDEERPSATSSLAQNLAETDTADGDDEEAPEVVEPKRPVQQAPPAAPGLDGIAALKRIEAGRGPAVGTRTSYRTIPGKDYVLDAYDRLLVSVRSMKSEEWPLTVSPQGVVTVPLVGPVRCSGMTIAELEKDLVHRLSRYLKEFDLSVVVTRVRGIQVTITGQVAGPGSYSLPGLASLWEAIEESGGITDAGSVRNVRIRDRHGKERTADLYPFLFAGRDECNPSLGSGDTIVVPVAERIVGLSGEVRGPGLYEVQQGETLSQLLALGGGPSAQAALDKAYLLRVLPDGTKLVLPAGLAAPPAETAPQEMRDGDVLVVPPVELFLGTVQVSGEVRKAGKYARAQNMRLRDLLNMAGGCTAAALPGRTYIRRVREDRTLQVIWVDAAKALAGDPSANIALMEGDQVSVPAAAAFAGAVAARGQVMKEIARVPLAQGMTVRDLLGIAGGLTVEAAPAQSYIERLAGAGGPKRLLWVDANRALQGDPRDNLPLQDGDSLFIPAIRAYLGKVTVTGEMRALISPPAPKHNEQEPDESLTKAAGADTRADKAIRMEYDLSEGMRVSDLVKLAGGPTAVAALQRARLLRVGPDGLRESLSVDLTAVLNDVGGKGDLALRDGDSLEVPSIAVLQKTVRVAGEVIGTGIFETPVLGANAATAIKRRGLYELKEGDTVRDLVQSVGGVTAYAALRAARIDRQRKDGTVEHIPVDLQRLLVQKDETANVTLQNGDEFTVPAIADMVYVVGAVNNPGAYEYQEGNSRVMDMIARAGGASPRAILSGVRLVRSDLVGKRDPMRVNMDAVMKRGKVHLDPGVRAGDVVIVPEKPIMMQDVLEVLANISLLRFYFGQ